MKKMVDKTKFLFSFIGRMLARGFFFYFYQFFNILSKLFKNCYFLKKAKRFFKDIEDRFENFFVVSTIILVTIGLLNLNIFDSLSDSSNNTSNDTSNDTLINDYNVGEVKVSKNNLFKIYENYALEDVDFLELKKINPDIVAWIYVEGTNINYPIVQTTDNEYYLKYNFLKKRSNSGWTYMDYRNSKMMSDNNTIFYGHNLLNKTSFGSISNIFTKDWYNNSKHRVIVLTDIRKYTYDIFSCYYTGEEVDYLQNNFYSDEEYESFLRNVKKKSKFKFNVSVTSSDNIITLSTCTEDNKGRKVVHAKVVNSELY